MCRAKTDRSEEHFVFEALTKSTLTCAHAIRAALCFEALYNKHIPRAQKGGHTTTAYEVFSYMRAHSSKATERDFVVAAHVSFRS